MNLSRSFDESVCVRRKVRKSGGTLVLRSLLRNVSSRTRTRRAQSAPLEITCSELDAACRAPWLVLTFHKINAPHDAPDPAEYKNGRDGLNDGGDEADDESSFPFARPVLRLAAHQDTDRCEKRSWITRTRPRTTISECFRSLLNTSRCKHDNI